jgi:glycosyltransferase involved in cell wall biosynthesis
VPFSIQMLGARFYGAHSSDPYQRALETLAEKLESNGVQVHRPGFVNRLALPRLLARSDVHVVPSRWEDPCPLTVLEGMATGQATVGASCGGVPELIGNEGFLFERDDVEGLEARLRVLLENPELRKNYGQRARNRALQRPWRTVFEELAEIANF